MTPVADRGLLRQLVMASRPLSWVNTAYPFAAAYLMSTREVDARLVVGTVFFLIPYNLLMYGINDVFDHESDLRNPRKGGVEGALLDPRVHRATVLSAALLPVPFVLWLLAVGSPAAAAVLAVSLFAVVAYSAPRLRFKERPVLDSMTSSTHFVSPALYGFVLAGAGIGRSAWLVLAAFFLWGVASQAFGAVQDIAADRAGGIASIATVLGAARTVRFSIVAWVAAGALLLATAWPGPLAAVLVLPYIALAWPFRSVGEEQADRAHRGWQQFLAANYGVGFLVTMLLIWVALRG
ncbi:prenyltransferase [Actinotalea sp.]|uniref:prenyltransferase n=1 Tax=Actinotalea sp. TaxID=1872145 RepID=UPI003564A65A